MRIKLLGVITFGSLFFGTSFIYAATVYLKNGRKMEGFIKSQDDKAIQLDIGGGLVSISQSKIDRIEKGEEKDQIELSEKMLRKVILTRKNAPKKLHPLFFKYNNIKDRYEEVLGFNDEVKAILRDRVVFNKEISNIQNRITQIDKALARGQRALGLSNYNALVTELNRIGGLARAKQERLRWGNERMQALRSLISQFRNDLIAFELKLEGEQVDLVEPDTKTALFYDELIVRVRKLQGQIKGRSEAFERQGLHTVVDVKLNGRITVPMLIDTGATAVALNRKMAEQLGLTLSEENASEVSIANGDKVKAYYVLLESVSVKGLTSHNVIAMVLDQQVGEEYSGLLGMSFLENFELILKPQTGLLELREIGF